MKERNQNTDFKTSRKLVFPSIDTYSFQKGQSNLELLVFWFSIPMCPDFLLLLL